MPEVMRQCDALGQILIELQRAGDAAADARHFHRVRQARAEVVARAVEEDLGLVFEPTEGAAVNDAVAVPLKIRAQTVLGVRKGPSARVSGLLRIGREKLVFELLQFDAVAWHIIYAGVSQIRFADASV